MMTPTYLVTGSSGFVGSHVLREILSKTDANVICLVTFRHRGSGDRLRLVLDSNPDWLKRVEVIHHDLTLPFDPILCKRLERVTAAFNIASESHVDRSITDPGPFVINNCTLVVNMLEWARQHGGLTHFFQFSTDEVYGPADEGYAHREWVDLHRPSNPYSASKAAQENIAYSYWRTYNVPVVVTNGMNIIGETQHPEKFMPKVINLVNKGGVVPIHGVPETGATGSRFYIHAQNVANAMTWLVTNKPATMYNGHNDHDRWHIVGQREVSNLDMALLVADMLGKPLHHKIVDFHSSRPGHDLRYALDGSKLHAAGWRPPLDFEQSVRQTIDWTIANPDWNLYDYN